MNRTEIREMICDNAWQGKPPAEIVELINTPKTILVERPLVRGTHKVQPYFELGDFKGRWGALSFSVSRIHT